MTSGPRRRSLRFRIVFAAVAVVTVLLGISGYTLITFADRTLRAQVDDALAFDADFIERALPTVANLPPGSAHPVLLVQLYSSSSGRLLGSNESADGISPLVDEEVVLSNRRPTFSTTEVADAGKLRVYLAPIGNEGRFQLAVARPIAEVDASIAALSRFVALTTPLLTLILAIVIWIVVDRALHPVVGMRQTLASIGPGELGRRVPFTGAGDEIDDLAGTMNEMLSRLDVSATRQRQFVADASHELRSPLAGMRVLLETETEHPTTIRASRSEALAEMVRLQHLIDDLLALARSDAEAPEPDLDAVDLDEIVLRHADHLRRAGDVAVDISKVSGGRVYGNASDLDRLVGNLTTNAARHARSTVYLELTSDDDASTVELAVSDDGPGIPEEDRIRVFERFTRLDDARSRESGGAGLGLAIVADIVEHHGGEVAIIDNGVPGARVEVRLPAHSV